MTTPDLARRDHVRAVALAVLVTMLWASSWVLIRFGLDAIPPITFAGLRYGLAAIVLGGWVASRRRLRESIRDLPGRVWLLLAGFGVVMYTVTQGAQFVAIATQPAATTSLVLSMTPLLVAAASTSALGEHPTARQAVGAAVVVVGATVYFAGDLGATPVGLVAAVVGLAANAAAAIVGRSVNRRGDVAPAVVTVVGMAVGAALLLVVGVSLDGVPSLDPSDWLIVGWLAVVNTAMAFTWWNVAQRQLSAVESAGINNTMLVQIAVLGWIFLDEDPGAVGIAGIVVVSAGVLMTQLSLRPRAERARPRTR